MSNRDPLTDLGPFMDALTVRDTPFLTSIKNPWHRPIIGYTEPVNARKHRLWQRVANARIFKPFAQIQQAISDAESNAAERGDDTAAWISGPLYALVSKPVRIRRYAERQATATGPQPIYDPAWKAPEWPTRMVWGMAERRDHGEGPVHPDRDQSGRDHADGPIADEGQNA